MRLALLAALLAAAALVLGAAASGGGIGLSASPLRLALSGRSSAAVTVRNPGRRTLVVAVSGAGYALSLRGRPRVRPARGTTGWLRLRPRQLRLAPGASAKLDVAAAPAKGVAPGDHPALVLLTTRPVGAREVGVRLRVGVVVVLHIPGRIVRRLVPRALTVERRGRLRVLELRLLNRGNVTERLGGGRLRLLFLRGSRTLATLRPRRRELLPHSRGIADFVYRGRVRGSVTARIELGPPEGGTSRTFRIHL